MGKRLVTSSTLLISLIGLYSSSFAATPVNLRHKDIHSVHLFTANTEVVETSRLMDSNGTLHVRAKQFYRQFPVWGADTILHIPNAAKIEKLNFAALVADQTVEPTMNGIIYENLDVDLANAPNVIFTEQNKQKALQQITKDFDKTGKRIIKDPEVNLIIYVDDLDKAHWAYRVHFSADPSKEGELPTKPNFIVDAVSFKVYQQWDEIKTQTLSLDNVDGGGYGGNQKMGKIIYDSLTAETHYPRLKMQRDAATNTCYLQNEDVTVKHSSTKTVVSFACEKPSAEHNNIFWDDALHAVNGGFSPDNDALFGGNVIKDLYQQWYGVPVLKDKDKPMMLNMVVHARMDNAYWDGRQMTFGDGINMFYPLTSLGVAAHEISHGFTEQHSNLLYYGQSGGMNESFSDMAAQAAEMYAYGKCSWQIGPEIFKAENEALRYMDQPSKDCKGKKPGNWCSIDSVDQYRSGLDVHFSSGIYNRIFYLMGTAEGWDAKKAFNVMLNANMHYWTSHTNFADGACGVLSAAKDLKYDLAPVQKAFKTVGVDISKC